jgi:hypothetical protein
MGNSTEEPIPLNKLKPGDSFLHGEDIFLLKGDGTGESYAVECIQSRNYSLGTYLLGKSAVIRRNGQYPIQE